MTELPEPAYTIHMHNSPCVQALMDKPQREEVAAACVAAERERCAAIADKHAEPGKWTGNYFIGYTDSAGMIAAAIRGGGGE